MNFNEVFSNRLSFYMNYYGISQKELAKRMNVSEASVSNWVKGVKVPRADKVDKLCTIFSCNRSDLVENPVAAVTPLVQQHITNYSRLKPDQQVLIDDLVTNVRKEQLDAAKVLEVLQKLISSPDP